MQYRKFQPTYMLPHHEHTFQQSSPVYIKQDSCAHEQKAHGLHARIMHWVGTVDSHGYDKKALILILWCSWIVSLDLKHTEASYTSECSGSISACNNLFITIFHSNYDA